MSADPRVVGARIARLGLALALGDRSDAVEAARELTGLAIDMIPVNELKPFLTERDRIWADLAADVAEEIKLAGTEDS